MNEPPEISVLMPVFNSERYLKMAIDSILNQTFKDFELIIINDGSTDSSEEVILSYSDLRIKYFKNIENIGLIATLNRGIDLCSSPLIARMDADDISLPERLQKQWTFLNEHPEVAMVGSDIQIIDENNRHVKTVKKYCPPHLIQSLLFFKCAFVHPSVLIRKDILIEFRYSADYIHAEDYFLWSQIVFKYPVASLPEVLIKYREHQQNVSAQYRQQQEDASKNIYAYHLAQLHIFPSDNELSLHYKLLRNPSSVSIFNKNERKNISVWIEKVLKQNEILQIYDQHYLSNRLEYRWSLKKKIHIILLKVRDKFSKIIKS